MKLLDMIAVLAAFLAGVLLLGQVPLLRIIGDDAVAKLWVAQAPIALFGIGALLALLPRVVERLVKRAVLAPARSDKEAYRRLFLLSVSALLLELALIRWIGAEIRFFAYFKNFVLISIFLGFGLGFALGPRKTRLYPVALVGMAVLALLVFLFNDVSLYPAVTSEEQTWGHQVEDGAGRLAFLMAFFLVCLVTFFAILCGTFAALVQEMGSLFERLPRIGAYTVNLVGSLVGIGAFNLLSWLETPPVLWFAAGLVPLGVLPGTTRLRWTWASSVAITLCLVTWTDQRQAGSDLVHDWSPYYRMSIGRTQFADAKSKQGIYSASVNRKMMSIGRIVDPALFKANYGVDAPPSTFSLPFRVKPDAKRVLILGMGMGNDVAGALCFGKPDRIVGVEIDPIMARYAKLFHPEHPLASPKVEVVVDDARHYVETTKETFDLVILGSLDSHTLLSAYSQLRTDNFLYTLECFQRIRSLLSEDGVLFIRYASDQDWIVARMAAAARAAFDQDPVLTGRGRVFCLVGPGLDREEMLADPVLAQWLDVHSRPLPPADQTYPTDDHPFLTIASRALPITYWIAIAVVVALTVVAIRVAGLPVRKLNWKFLVLGGAFLLAETRLITLAGLMFGVTWEAYGIALSLVMGALVAGTLLASRFQPKTLWPIYGALLVAIAISQGLASTAQSADSFGLRLGLALLLFGPIFLIAGYLFAAEFARVESSEVSVVLASNLLGSVVGGLLEYQALSAGISSLAVTATLLYAVAGFLSWRGSRSG